VHGLGLAGGIVGLGLTVADIGLDDLEVVGEAAVSIQSVLVVPSQVLVPGLLN